MYHHLVSQTLILFLYRVLGEGHGRHGPNQIAGQLTGPRSGCQIMKLYKMSEYIVSDMTPIGAKRAIWVSTTLQMHCLVLFSIVRPFLKTRKYVHSPFILSTIAPYSHIVLFAFGGFISKGPGLANSGCSLQESHPGSVVCAYLYPRGQLLISN